MPRCYCCCCYTWMHVTGEKWERKKKKPYMHTSDTLFTKSWIISSNWADDIIPECNKYTEWLWKCAAVIHCFNDKNYTYLQRIEIIRRKKKRWNFAEILKICMLCQLWRTWLSLVMEMKWFQFDWKVDLWFLASAQVFVESAHWNFFDLTDTAKVLKPHARFASL